MQSMGSWAQQSWYLVLGTQAKVLRLTTVATGPLNQATGPPRSNAGVGIGMLIGDRDYLARKQRNWQNFVSCFLIEMKFMSKLSYIS